MILRKRVSFAKVVCIIMLVSIVMTSNGIVMAVETDSTQVMANDQRNMKTEGETERNSGENFATKSEEMNETGVSNRIVSSLDNLNVSTNITSLQLL